MTFNSLQFKYSSRNTSLLVTFNHCN